MLPLLHPGLSSEGRTPPGSRAANRNPGHAQLHVDLGCVSGTLPDRTLVMHASPPPAGEIAGCGPGNWMLRDYARDSNQRLTGRWQ